jgi:enediyne biosynthesis protein E4
MKPRRSILPRGPVWPWAALGAAAAALAIAAPACRPGGEPPVAAPHADVPPQRQTAAPAETQPEAIHGILLQDASATTGIEFVHNDGSSGHRYLPEAMASGVALFDYDNDGLIDIYFLSGAPLFPARPDSSVRNALYRNEGNFRFRDVTDEAGVGHAGFALGVAVADYDNDGYADLYVTNFGFNVLYRNNGDGTFTDVTQAAGVAGGGLVGAGTCFLDVDGDGQLDLYAANYVYFRCEHNVRRTMDGFPSYPGPLDFQPTADLLFRNNGDGTFADISQAAGVAQVAGTDMGVICADYDHDGDTDIFVMNDEMGNFLFENDGTGRFQEVAVLRGLAYSRGGQPLGNMGVDCADYDRDGRLDFFTTTFSNELPTLYRNMGRFFEDVTLASGAAAGALPHSNWGTGFADFDNDGLPDLLVANGDFEEHVHRWKPGTALRTRNVLLKNVGRGKFLNISDECGDGLAPVFSSRGIGLDDLDNDGRIDAVVLNWRERPTIVRNASPTEHHWLQVQLHGRRANRDGVGAHVRITAGGQTQLAEVHSGRGYQSHHGTRLHFGLGTSDHVERIEVRWLGGGTQVIKNVPSGQRLQVIEADPR